jgi:hypothetical protein
MRETAEQWAVYEAIQGKAVGIRSVCTDSEWQALELTHPGLNMLVQKGIASEADAEKLARGTSGDPVAKRGQRPASRPAPSDEI